MNLTHASRVSIDGGELVASISHELAQPITVTTAHAKRISCDGFSVTFLI